MKSSQILASVLFGTFAAAVPFKRDLVTKTEVVVETVIVYTTVWDDVPAAEATTTGGGYFYEVPSSSAAKTTSTSTSTSTPAYVPSPAQEPSSVYTPPAPTSASSTEVVVPSVAAPPPTSAAPPPETSSTPPAAVPTTSAAAYVAPVADAAPAPTSADTASSGSTSSGETFTGDLTINPLTGALGACGKPLYATDMVVALAADAWGASTYDTMTGEATNPWCGKKINIEYNGKTVPATIMDLCPGCSGHDIDLSDAAWAAIGMTEWTRVKGSWSLAE